MVDSEGRVLRDASVYIMRAEEKKIPSWRELYSAIQGTKRPGFKFVHVPPGRYLLVVNPDDARGSVVFFAPQPPDKTSSHQLLADHRGSGVWRGGGRIRHSGALRVSLVCSQRR